MSGNSRITIYTDGACSGNPGRGGYAAILTSGEFRREISGGFKRTTNNRMELLACIEALRKIRNDGAVVTLYSDSKYVVDGIAKGWARRWRENGWRKANKDRALNPDLWAELLDLCERHEVTFRWVRGHDGVAENELCDKLAVAASQAKRLAEDAGYEAE